MPSARTAWSCRPTHPPASAASRLASSPRVVRIRTGRSRYCRCERRNLKYVEPVHVGHVQVQHDRLDGIHGERFDALEARARLGEVDGYGRKRGTHHSPDRRRIVDDENCWHHTRSAGGPALEARIHTARTNRPPGGTSSLLQWTVRGLAHAIRRSLATSDTGPGSRGQLGPRGDAAAG